MGNEHLADRWRGALLGTALGDAVGRPFEGRPAVEPHEVDAWLDATERLVWTDDTAMTIALARSLIACGGRVDPQHLGDTFADSYHRQPWRGYGAGPPRVFAAAATGVPYVEAAANLFDGGGSFGNGAAMRAAPVAIAGGDDPKRVATLAREQAQVTHAHDLGQDGAALQALATWTVAREPRATPGASISSVLDLLDTPEVREAAELALELGGADVGTVVRRLGNGIAAVEAAPAALAAFLGAPDDPTAVLRRAVCLGGDTDTIAAMAGALCGASVGADALPGGLLTRLEASTELVDLADTLALVVS